MAKGTPLGPQPDFKLIATEILKLPNLPAIAGGQQILAELRELREELTRGIAAVRGDVAALRGDVAALRGDVAALRGDVADTRRELIAMMTASNHNNTARVQNTYLASRVEPLSPFLNLNGAVIPEFPTTSTELGQMNGQQLDTVLQQLGLQPAHGADSAVKKRMLRAHIGLREVPAEPAP